MTKSTFVFVMLFLVSTAEAAAPRSRAIHMAVGAKSPFTSTDGVRWSPEFGSDGGAVVRSDDASVTSTRDARIYKAARVGAAGYHLPFSNGGVTVRFHLIEHDEAITGADQRIFNIDVEDSHLDNIDIWTAASGHWVPLVYAVRANIRDGTLDIRFNALKGAAVVSAIEVEAEAHSHDQSGFTDVTPLQEHLFPVGSSIRVDYRVDSTLPYSTEARIRGPLQVDLTGHHTLRAWVRPDGSERMAYLILHDEKGESAAYGFSMTGTEPREVRFSLDHARPNPSWWYASETDPSFARKIVAMTICFRSMATGKASAGGGFLVLGPIVATDEVTPTTPPPRGSKMKVFPGRLSVVDFEGEQTDEEFQERYTATMHGGPAVMRMDRNVFGDGRQSLRMDYTFYRKSYSGFVLFKTMDIRPYNAIRLWVKPDGSGNWLRVFMADVGAYVTLIPLGGTTPQRFTIPFSTFLGKKATVNGLQEWGFWVQKVGDSRGGSINIDAIEFIHDGSLPQGTAQDPPPVALPGDRISRIDSGNQKDMVDGNGNRWLSDRGYHWGLHDNIAAADVARYPANPLREVYATAHYGMTGYSFAIPNGLYQVKLHFGEVWDGALVPGRRVCGVAINGKAQPDVDAFAETGGRFRYLVRTQSVEVKDGEIQIDFQDRPAANHCKLEGIEIIPQHLMARMPSQR